MNTKNQINLLKFRLHQLTVRDKDNAGVCRKIQRQIRNLERTILSRDLIRNPCRSIQMKIWIVFLTKNLRR